MTSPPARIRQISTAVVRPSAVPPAAPNATAASATPSASPASGDARRVSPLLVATAEEVRDTAHVGHALLEPGTDAGKTATPEHVDASARGK